MTEPQSPPDEQAMFDRLAELNRTNRLDEAEEIGRIAIPQYPDSARLWIQHGLTALLANSPSAAIDRFATVRKSFPDCLEGYHYGSVSARRANDKALAEDIIENWSRRFPDDASISIERAWIASMSNDSDQALAAWDLARARCPDSPEGYWVGTHEALKAGKLQLAEEIASAGRERFPSSGQILREWARVANQRGDWTEAERRWRLMKEIAPQMAEIRLGLGEIALAQGHVRHADIEAEKDDLGELLLHFESIGDNCEFGIVQRLAGIEPLGLLRWASIPPNCFTAMLEANFSGVGDACCSEIYVTDTGEYAFRDTRYFRMHTFMRAGLLNADEVLQQALRRSKFLARKMDRDLKSGEKILVYKNTLGPLSEADMDAIARSIRRYGNSPILFVHKANFEGNTRVISRGDNVYLASMPELTLDPLTAGTRSHIWHEICREVYALAGSARA